MTAGAGMEATRTVLQRHGVLSREKRKQMFGLDCPDTLEWRSWVPGTEYTKNIVVKNVSAAAVKIRYKQTASKAFSMDFPDPIKLRPGMSCPLKVVFRPLKTQQYSDHLEIFVNDMASFIVLVEAYTPAVHILVPATLDFGFVPCKEEQHQQLTVRNTGDIKVYATWKLSTPFSISPGAASLAPGASATFAVAFLPQEAGSFVAQATCQLDNGSSTICKVTGVAKFPYLSMEQPRLDFGEVVVGRTVERTIRFGNHSMVPANFMMTHENQAASDNVFSMVPTSGTLGPEEYSQLRVVYTPKHTGTFSCEVFLLGTVGGNQLKLTLAGAAVAPQVTLSTRAFNFGNVVCGTSPSRVLYMQNHSDLPVLYDFQVDALDCFTISKPKGTLAAGLTGHVTITFSSTVPANYWRRLVLLLKDADAFGVDLLATAYNDKSRPPPLEHRHVAAYLDRVTAGGPPVDYDFNTAGSVMASPVASYHGSRPMSPMDAIPLLGAEGIPTVPSLAMQTLPGPDAWPLLFEGQDPAHAVSVDTDLLEFGTCSKLSAGEYQPVIVTNNTTVKVTTFILAPLWQDPSGGPPQPVFQAFPETVDIKPGGQATFKVAFRPCRDAAHYAQTLVLCGHVKSQRNFRLVLDSQVIPPWSVPIVAVGNTYLHTNPEFSPKVDISHKLITFQPCRPNEQVCQMLTLTNYGDTPAAFNFENAKVLAPLFAIRPALGVIAPRSHALVAIRFKPITARAAAATALLTFNGAALSRAEVALRGTAHAARLVLNTGAGATTGVPTLFFRPTCVGAVSQRGAVLTNPSRVPVAWQWQLPSRLEGVMEVSPFEGVLRGNESIPLSFSFAPNKLKVYDTRAPCALMAPGAQSPPVLALVAEPSGMSRATSGKSVATADALVVRLVGEGTAAVLALDPPSLDLGPVKVGHPVQRTVRLINQSDGVLQYVLECTAADGRDGGPVDGLPEPGAAPVELEGAATASDVIRAEELWVDEPEGTIAARASKQVTVTFYPRYRKAYALELRCRSANAPPPLLGSTATPRPPSGSGPGALRLPPLPTIPTLEAGVDAMGSGLQGPAVEVLQGAGPAGVLQGPAIVCPLVALATFPALVATDAFCECVPKPVLWGQLELPVVNQELASGVTPMEMELSKMEDRGRMTTDAACSLLQPYVLDLGCVAVGGPPVVLHLELSNRGPLPVAWEAISYDAPDIEVENWVEPGQPRNEAERKRDFVTKHRLLEWQPHVGSLAPGGRTTLSVMYRPTHVGLHEFPVFLRIADGKKMQLVLRGETVMPPVQRLALGPTYRVLTLPPTPIGCVAPPVQMMLLRNGGPGQVTFEVDLRPLRAQVQLQHGEQVMRLCSPPAGQIPEGGAAVVGWQFVPLEAKVYQLQVPLRMGNGSIEIITLLGRGYHPSLPSVPEPLPSEGDRDWAKWDGYSTTPAPDLANSRLALPSHDTLSMGTTLPGGVARRVLVLTNTSVYPVLFDWGLGPLADPVALQGGHLDIQPMTGRLEPGERVVARLSLTAPLVPLLLEAMVECWLAVDEEAVLSAVNAAQEESAEAAAAADREVTDTGSVVDEVVVRHPDRSHGHRPSRLKSRIPLHLGMTAAAVARSGRLGEQWAKTLGATQIETGGGATQFPDLPAPQRLHVALTGRVLDRSHIQAGLFTPPHELADARSVLEGSVWVPPTQQPFYLAPGLQASAHQAISQAIADHTAAMALAAQAAEAEALSLVLQSQSACVEGLATTAADHSQALHVMTEGLQGSTGLPEEVDSQEAAAAFGELVPSRRNSLELSHSPMSHSPMVSLTSPLKGEDSEQGMDITFAGGVGPGGVLEVVAEGSEAEEGEESPMPARTPEQEASEARALPGREQPMHMQSSFEAAASKSAGDPSDDTCGQDPRTPVRTPVQIPMLNLVGNAGNEVHTQLLAAARAVESIQGQAEDGLADEAGQQQSSSVDIGLPGDPSVAEGVPGVCAPLVATPVAPSPLQVAAAVATQLLQQLLREVVDPSLHHEVSATLDCLPRGELPLYVQLAKGEIPNVVVQGGGVVPLALEADNMPRWSPNPAASLSAGDTNGASTQWQPAEAQPEQGGGDGLEEVMRSPRFQEFSEYVMERVLMGLIEESVAGEWEPSN